MSHPHTSSSSLNIDHSYRRNVIVECCFSIFNGVFLALILFGAPIVAEKGLDASALSIALLVSAFPAGAFIGPVWAAIGRRWGMKNLVRGALLIGSCAMMFMFFVSGIVMFTLLVATAQLMNSAMRMGQASLYRIIYPERQRGRVLGWVSLCSYCTMVPTMILTGWLLDLSKTSYQYIYPVAGLCGLAGFVVYGFIRVNFGERRAPEKDTLRGSALKYHAVFRNDRLYVLYQIAFFLTGGAFFLSRPAIIKLTADRFQFSALEMMICLSVIPPILLALGSPWWGSVLDRIGLIRCRLLISALLSASLFCFFAGLTWEIAALMYVGSMLQGISNGGGQITWFLGSSYLAPNNDDVPMYNSIHFVLNGIRGMALPWVGAALLVWTGTGAVLAAVALSLGSVPVLWRALALKDDRLGEKMNWWFPRRGRREVAPAPTEQTVDDESHTSEREVLA